MRRSRQTAGLRPETRRSEIVNQQNYLDGWIYSITDDKIKKIRIDSNLTYKIHQQLADGSASMLDNLVAVCNEVKEDIRNMMNHHNEDLIEMTRHVQSHS